MLISDPVTTCCVGRHSRVIHFHRPKEQTLARDPIHTTILQYSWGKGVKVKIQMRLFTCLFPVDKIKSYFLTRISFRMGNILMKIKIYFRRLSYNISRWLAFANEDLWNREGSHSLGSFISVIAWSQFLVCSVISLPFFIVSDWSNN